MFEKRIFYLLDKLIERIRIGDRAVPDVFAAVLPVRFRSPPFIAFPRNAIANAEVLVGKRMYCTGTSPISTNIDRRRRLEDWQQRLQRFPKPLGVRVDGRLLECPAVKLLGEVVRRIDEQQIHKSFGQQRMNVKHVLANRSVENLLDASRLAEP